ncbi:UNVERIFIED_CONTAM: hypothetical protein HDU68_004061 [Siphonaria sp. JEL0065]|nr:hypothetical protein HDU68_004061 [Siphonaria sp. JEL0065]
MQVWTLLSAVALISTQVSAHGFLGWPISRILPGDQQNGYTFGRAATNRNTAVHPDPDANCAYLPKGPVFTQTMAPGIATLDYTITAFHMGGCNATISLDGQKTWQLIGVDPTCGVQASNPTGRGSFNVTIPDGTYSAVIRWTYEAANGGDPNELFNNCADINVAPSGSNQHLQVELLSGTSPWTTQLPKTPWQYQSASCGPTGSTLCAGPGSSFINQCVSLAAGGGFNGGSSYYQYQCPFGSTCQTVNGVDACVGPNVPTSTTTTTTTASSKTTIPPTLTAPSKSTTTSTTTTVPPTTSTTTTTARVSSTSSTTTTTTLRVTTSASSSTTTTTTLKASSTTTTTTTTAGGVPCDPSWVSTQVYPSAGAKVSYQNANFVNKWWTQGETPDATKSSGVWTYQGACGGSPATTGATQTKGSTSATAVTQTAAATSTATGVPGIVYGTPCPVLADNSLRLPFPVGQTCVDVKHACQTFCLNSNLSNIQRNQCFGEDANNTATQWCQCNDLTLYGVAFGKPTTQCPV